MADEMTQPTAMVFLYNPTENYMIRREVPADSAEDYKVQCEEIGFQCSVYYPPSAKPQAS
jgi:hypothetical protein